MQDSRLGNKTEEIQYFADRKDTKKFHDALETIYDPKSTEAITLLSSDGSTLLTVKKAILERWAKHFNSVLNRPSSIIETSSYQQTSHLDYTSLCIDYHVERCTISVIIFGSVLPNLKGH